MWPVTCVSLVSPIVFAVMRHLGLENSGGRNVSSARGPGKLSDKTEPTAPVYMWAFYLALTVPSAMSILDWRVSLESITYLVREKMVGEKMSYTYPEESLLKF